MSLPETVEHMGIEDASEFPVAVSEDVAEAIHGLNGLSGPQGSGSEGGDSDSDSDTGDSDDYDDLDYSDLSWTGGRYDCQEQKDFIKNMVLQFSGYEHDLAKTSKERCEERKRISNDRNTQHRHLLAEWPSSDKVMKDFHPLLHNPQGLAPPNAPPI